MLRNVAQWHKISQIRDDIASHTPTCNLTYSQQLPCSVVVHVLSLANDRSIVCRSTREADAPWTMDVDESTTTMVDADTPAVDSK